MQRQQLLNESMRRAAALRERQQNLQQHREYRNQKPQQEEEQEERPTEGMLARWDIRAERFYKARTKVPVRSDEVYRLVDESIESLRGPVVG